MVHGRVNLSGQVVRSTGMAGQNKVVDNLQQEEDARKDLIFPLVILVGHLLNSK